MATPPTSKGKPNAAKAKPKAGASAAKAGGKAGGNAKAGPKAKAGASAKAGGKARAPGSGTAKGAPSSAKRPAPAPRRPAPAGGSRPGWVIPAAVVGVVVALLVVAVVATRLGGGDGDGDLAQTRPVRVSGAALPELPEGTDPAVGMPAPVVSGASFDGRPVEIGSPGRPRLVFFVAHWCPHCQREVPLLAPELGRITPAGVEVLTVATGTQANAPNYPPSKWLRDEGWPTTVLADDGDSSAAKAFGLSGYPFYVLLGADGKVVSRGSGEKSVAEVESLLNQVAPAPAG